MAFPENLRNQREKHGLSQQQLAESLGVTQAVISLYENGSTSPTITLAVKLAEILGTTCEKLVHD